MGNKLARTTQVSATEYYLHDLPSSYNLVLKEVLGGGRLFKSVQCVHDEGLLLVKVYFKRGEFPDLKEYERRLHEIRMRLKNLEHSHVWPFQYWLETDKAAYLLRQYFFSNLHDRISTRPFLSIVEKKWLAFQLLYALKQCHEHGICHGDIKCENVLVTSWNWVYLADFASFKPTYLPFDFPTDFSFFFDTGGRRRCYLAPERFYDPTCDPPVSADAPLKSAMDIFSLGCVIAELFLEGQALFDLSQLLAYRKGQYDPRPSLLKIPDKGIQDMIIHMIQVSPDARSSPAEYLHTWAPTVFPSYFSPLLHKFFSCLLPLDTDTRVAVTQGAFTEIRKQMIADAVSKVATKVPTSVRQDVQLIDNFEGVAQELGMKSPRVNPSAYQDEFSSSNGGGAKYTSGGTVHRVKVAAVVMSQKHLPIEAVELGRYSERLFARAEVGSMFPNDTGKHFKEDSSCHTPETCVWEKNSGFPCTRNITGKKELDTEVAADQQLKCEGMVLIASLLCACLRSVRLPQARRGAVQLLHEASCFCDNDARLQHILPYVVALLSDAAAIVRCAALETLCNLLSMTQNFPPSDAKIFPEYILPLLSMLPDDPEESVRIAYANNIHKIAKASLRFLLNSHYLIEGGGSLDSPPQLSKVTAQQNGHSELELSHLRETIARVIQELVMGQKQTPTIRRALLQHVGPLCQFFGLKQSNDFLLPILPAFLNDRDEQLRAVFFEHIIHVCIFVGQASLEAYLLPYIEQALNDVEETVIVNALECLAALCVQNLLRKRVVLDGVERASPLLCHPSQWVRRASVTFIAATSANLEPVDSHAYLSPILSPFLRREPASLCSETAVLACLKPPVSREVFNRVLSDVMLAQTQPDTAIKLKTKGRQRIAPIQPATQSGAPQLRISTSDKRRDMGNVAIAIEAPARGAAGRRPAARWSSSGGHDVQPSVEAEDGEKMKAMEGYIRNLSSTMQTRMHNWEIENSEKLESSSMGLPPGVGAGYYSNYDGTAEGIPLYSVPLADKKFEGLVVQGNGLPHGSPSYNEEWSRITGVRPSGAPYMMAAGGGSLGPASSQWATITAHTSMPVAEPLQKSVAVVPITPKLMAGSIYPGGSMAVPRRLYEVVKDANKDGEMSISVPVGNKPNLACPSEIGMLGGANITGVMPNLEDPTVDSVSALLGSLHLGQSAIESSWRPRGVLIAHLQEHQRAVNEIAVAKDNLFFVSASDDGSVKVWDCRRLERDISFRSRLTYSFENGRVLCVTMLNSGHQVAAASSAGIIQVFNIDYVARLGGCNERYTGFSDVRKIESDEGAVVCLKNFSLEGPPLLLYSTQRNRIHLWDLRSQNEVWTLKAKPAHGYISTMALDPGCNWLVSGTSRGIVTLWDLRFQIPVNSWNHPGQSPIESMCPVLPSADIEQSSAARPCVYISAGQDEVAIWNAEDGSCHQVLRLAANLTDIDRNKLPAALVQQNLNLKYGSTTGGGNTHTQVKGWKLSDYRTAELHEPAPRLSGIRALLPLAGGTGLLSGGTDCRVSLWDRLRPERSYVVCGPTVKGTAPEQLTYETRVVSGVRIVQELAGAERSNNSNLPGNKFPSGKHGLAASAVDSVGCHRDCVLSLASAFTNQRLLISSSRDGVIKVWK